MKNYIPLFFTMILSIFSTGFINPLEENEVASNNENLSFAAFLSYFEKSDQAFDLSFEDIKKYEQLKISKQRGKRGNSETASLRKNLIKFIPDLQRSMLSRMGPSEVVPLARYYPDENAVAVMYMSYLPFGNNADMNFFMVLYDLEGNILPKKQVAAQNYDLSFPLAEVNRIFTQTFNMDQKGYIWKNTYINKWKADIKKTGIEHNEIVAYELDKTEVFKIILID